MKTSGLFTLHRYNIFVESYNKPIKIIFFGDVHHDAPLHAKEKWREFLDYAKPLKNTYFFGMGDYLDSMSTSERLAMMRASEHMHESTRQQLVDNATRNIDRFVKDISFMRGRLIGLLNGNHYYEYPSGINCDQIICDKLGCKYLGVSSFVRVSINIKSTGHKQSFDIWAHHGAGASRMAGGSLNRVDQMREHADADIYAMGHDHKRGVIPANPRVSLESCTKSESTLRLRERQQWLVRSGSFLLAYEDGKTSYNADACRGPCSLGHVEIEITPRLKLESRAESKANLRKSRRREITLDFRGIS